jgi:hypothetical protein
VHKLGHLLDSRDLQRDRINAPYGSADPRASLETVMRIVTPEQGFDPTCDGPFVDEYVGPSGRRVVVPHERVDTVAEGASAGDIRAASLASHAIAEVMYESGPIEWEVIEERAVRRVRERLVIWNITTPETFYRIGLMPRPPVACRFVRPVRVPRRRRRVRASGSASRARAPARPRRTEEGERPLGPGAGPPGSSSRLRFPAIAESRLVAVRSGCSCARGWSAGQPGQRSGRSGHDG